MSKFFLQHISVISKLDTKVHNFSKINYKYLVINLLQLTFALHFFELLHKKKVKMRQQRISDKTPTFGATTLRQPRKFYTTAGCDC